ncbi:MAG: cupin domain-containing protein [Syntrophomonadaceae bacterium]|nr:cupin domain-containing protein [Syntrophomonadaceae bacterium]
MNIFSLPFRLPVEEVFEPIIPDKGVLIERIISTGQITPANVWLEQERDEWVVLLQGRAILSWENGKTLAMEVGDWVFIPAHERHRVEYTSKEPPCIWLAVLGKLT